ncbi:hypothetical protein QBC40DRAFT_222553 [Triangularia verruculosa]|uniref:NAD-dependent epimerase/dehydratase domain-containing protein n=1 Tax=Triangularia verruculosa TaxID=2587418 RepID=A0AAN6XKC7_9PEZI|nr:hypothetical protein QBC40DRAFT_222553 [Triangularia verruculosa]
MSSRIFITGGTGFIGSQVVADSLKAGHQLRISVRREAQVQEVKNRFAQYASQLDFAVIPDIGNTEAIQAALSNDVDAIFHLASPMPGKGEDFKTEYLQPAVQGTEAILNAAANSPVVKRVVIMSSILALMPLGGMSIPGLEVKAGTNPALAVDAEMSFPSGPAGYGAKYSASKILAHRATLEWMQVHQPRFSLVTLHPTFVLGRDMTQPTSTPNGINGFLMTTLTNPPGGKPAVPASMVDVRDVSLTVLRSLDVEAGKEELVTEYLVAGDPTSYDDVVSFVKKAYPEIPVNVEGPYDKPFTSDTSRTEKDLGIMRWHSTEEIVSSVLDQQLEIRRGEGKGAL